MQDHRPSRVCMPLGCTILGLGIAGLSIWAVAAEPEPAKPPAEKAAEKPAQPAAEKPAEKPAVQPAAAPAAAAQPAAPPAVQQRGVQIRVGPGGFRQVIMQNGQAKADDENAEDALIDGVFLPPDRTAKRRLETAREMLEARRFAEAAHLGSLLESPEDYFFKPDPRQSTYRSLKAEAGSLVGKLSPEGRDAYELQFGARARHMLADAVAASDMAALAEISRRFFYTQAGGEAAMLLGRHHLDHGRPLAAALVLERLLDTPNSSERFEPMLSLTLATSWLRAGIPNRAADVLLRLRNSNPRDDVAFGPRLVPWFNLTTRSRQTAEAVAWLTAQVGAPKRSEQAQADQWAMFRGDAARNAASGGGQPLLNPRWRVRSANHPALEKVISQLRQAYVDQDIAALPTLHPLAVNDVVLMRTARNLLAVDFATGKRIWEARTQADNVIDQLTTASQSQQALAQAPQLAALLDQRMWDDATFGTISSDGECVFALEELGLNLDDSNPRVIVMANGQRRIFNAATRDFNRLTAYELRTEGKRKWVVGGLTGDDEPKLAGVFFLGPPLPLLDRLYVLGESKGQEIRLYVLSPKTGALEWSQQLAVVERNIIYDSNRRFAGASPSFADGVLVCPTSAGAVVAVDLTTRSLLWGFQYARNQESGMDRLAMLRAGMYGQERRGGDRWADGSITIAGGRVLVTPLESEQLFCLNLLDGQVAWKQDRGTNMYVACVHKDHVIVVGHSQVSAWNLADGKQNWTEPLDLPSGSAPSGRGFQGGNFYFLPLSSAEVVKIDLDKGQIVDRARSRRGIVPGNLICYRGEVISQGVDFVEAFYQLESLQRRASEMLARQPDDPQALSALGEIRLNEGKVQEAIGLFRKSYEKRPDELTREMLVESLLAGLRADFAANRAVAKELEGLIEQKQQQASYLRLVAVGLQKSGATREALDAYLKLIDQDPDRDEPDDIDDLLSARRDRWLRAQLAELREQGTAEDRRTLDEVVQARLASATAARSTKALRQFLSIFGSHPAADDAREQLATLLSGPETLLERESLWRRLERSSDAARMRAAKARLAALFIEASRPELAAGAYRELAERFGDVVCLGGKTGRQLRDELPQNSPARPLLTAAKPWPVGDVKGEVGGKKSLSNSHFQRPFDLEFRGDPGEYFRNVSVYLDQQQQSIAAVDPMGNELFRVTISAVDEPRRVGHRFNRFNAFNNFNGFNPTLNSVSVNGHLLILGTGSRLIAIDTLAGRDSANRALLWSQDLTSQVPGVSVNQGVHPRHVNVPWGMPRFMPADVSGRLIGSMGPVTDDGICFQRSRELVCADPLTGEIVWTRKGMPMGSDIFGDDELLFIAPPEGGEALVIRSLDGALVGSGTLPPIEQRMATIGRLMLMWRQEETKQVLVLRDPWAEKNLWTRAIEPGMKAAMSDLEAVGVLEPSGKFVLLGAADGKPIVEEQLQRENSLQGINLLRSNDQYLLLTHSPPRAASGRTNISAAPGGLNNPLVSGRLYGFDRASGKKLWPTPVAIDQHGLVLNQPRDLPILVFARNVNRATITGQREQRTSIMCIDKRNGRMVYKNEDLPNSIANFEVLGDRADNTVAVLLPNKTITLTLTDNPIPPEKPEDANAKAGSEAGSTAGAILRIFGKAARDISGAPDDE